MTDIRKDRTSRRRAGATLVLAAATGGLLAAAMAGSPVARADDPFTDIANDVQASITAGDADYTLAGEDFAGGGDTDAGLVNLVAGFDDIFVNPAEYTALGLTAAGTGTDFGTYGNWFDSDYLFGTIPLTATAFSDEASTLFSTATTDFEGALSDLSGGDYFDAGLNAIDGGWVDLLGGQFDSLAALFGSSI
jgi:uncharacterized Zn-binding protein involved in type VI secretion